MKDNFVITTTGNIEGATIKQYIDVVCNNVVVGTNIFSDFAASLTDFLGVNQTHIGRNSNIFMRRQLRT